MQKLDTKFTERLQVWLNEDHSSEQSIMDGATLLLQLNRNRTLFNQIMNNPSRPQWKEKLEYELKKFLVIRLDEKTRDDVIRMDIAVMKEAPKILAQGEVTTADDGTEEVVLKGKRQDHDSLPDNIKQLWTRNASRWKKIAQLHATLMTMQDAPSCDRYELLKPMDELEKDYRKDMETYDNYEISDSIDNNNDKNTDSTDKEDDTIDPEREVNVARTWLSRNRKKLIRLYEDAYKGSPLDQQNYEDFLVECNAQVKRIFDNNGTMTDKLKTELKGYGVTIPEDEKADADEV